MKAWMIVPKEGAGGRVFVTTTIDNRKVDLPAIFAAKRDAKAVIRGYAQAVANKIEIVRVRIERE